MSDETGGAMRAESHDSHLPDPPATKKVKQTISIPLSVEATALLKSRMSVYAGQVTQANFLALVSGELGLEANLPGALSRVIGALEAERQAKLGLTPQPIGEASGLQESAPAASSGPARVQFVEEEP